MALDPRGSAAVTESEQRRIRLLQWLYDYRPEQPGELAAIADFLGGEPDEHTRDLWRGTVRTLARDGLITLADSSGFSGISALITDDGRAAVEAWRARHATEQQEQHRRRADPALRRAAAVDGLLRWLYEQDPDGTTWTYVEQILTSEYASFEGDHLPEKLISKAAQRLQDDGLVLGVDGAESDGPIAVQITRQGQDCIESGGTVTEYLRQKNAPTNVTTFHGPVSGNVSWDSAQVTQTASTSGLAGDELGPLVQAIVEALPADLPDAVRDEIIRDGGGPVLRHGVADLHRAAFARDIESRRLAEQILLPPLPGEAALAGNAPPGGIGPRWQIAPETVADVLATIRAEAEQRLDALPPPPRDPDQNSWI